MTLTTPARSTATRTPGAPPRHDLYGAIHKALRHFMLDTLLRAGRFDAFDADDTQRMLGQLGALLTQCEQHLKHENEFVHTAIEARHPGGAGRIADEHVEHLESIAALREDMHQLRAATGGQRLVLALRLYRHLALFVADNFEHMHYEETVHNAALWAHYSDAELMEMHHRLLAGMAPQESLNVARWMIPMVAPVERAAIVGGMKAGMPPEAFLGVLDFVRPHLDDDAWAKLARAVGVAFDLGRPQAR